MAAEQWSQAHEIVVHTLAPEAVIRGDIKLLERLLEPIDETKVEGWEEGGQVRFALSLCFSRRALTSSPMTRQTFLDYFHCLSHQHALHAPVAVTSTSSAELHSRHAHLLSVIDAVQRLAARKDLQRKERIKLKVAVAEMMSRLTVLARGADEVSLVSFASLSLSRVECEAVVWRTDGVVTDSTSRGSNPPHCRRVIDSLGSRERMLDCSRTRLRRLVRREGG